MRFAHRVLSSIALSLVFSCGGGTASTGPAERPPQLPEVDGQAVLDVPIERAPLPAQRLWSAMQAMRQRPRPSPPASVSTMQDYGAWMRGELAAWLRLRADMLTSAHGDADELLGAAPREQLFASIVLGVMYDEFATQLRSLPPPPGLDGRDALELFRGALLDQTMQLATTAHEAFENCVAVAPGAPEALRGWADRCRARASSLEQYVGREPAEPAAPEPPRGPEIPAYCQGSEEYADPDADPPDTNVAPEVAVIYEGDRITGADRDRFLEAVHRKIDALVEMPLVPRADVARAERLHAQRKWTQRGPACGQAPPLPALIAAARHRHLVLARVMTACGPGATLDARNRPAEDCRLAVYFDRAGSDDDENLPPAVSVSLGRYPSATPAEWLAAVEQLGTDTPDGTANIFGVLRSDERVYRVLDHGDDDPWLRVAPTLHEQTVRDRIAACWRASGIASYSLRFTISPAGRVGEVDVEPSNLPEDADETAADAAGLCIAEALREAAFPCTRNRRPAQVEARVCVGQ